MNSKIHIFEILKISDEILRLLNQRKPYRFSGPQKSKKQADFCGFQRKLEEEI